MSQKSMSKLLQETLKQKIYTPLLNDHKDLSLEIGVKYKGTSYTFSFGPKYKYFDLASLTKPIFTMSLFMDLEEKYPGFVNRKVKDILPWFKYEAEIKDLLAHQSGAPALHPVFEKLMTPTLLGLSPLNLLIRDVEFTEKDSVYSDVGFFVLAAILEEVLNQSLYNSFLTSKNKAGALSKWNGMHFVPLVGKRAFGIQNYAPTEECPLRGKKIQGEVHDESCWKMGGVSTHAGFFGDLKDVMSWVETAKEVFAKQKHYSKKTIAKFYKKQKADWRLGMMVPSRPRSTAGKYFSEASFGHLGFTGTSFWVDPKKDFSVVILSNRTYPDRRINSLNQFRPLIHNTIWEVLNHLPLGEEL